MTTSPGESSGPWSSRDILRTAALVALVYVALRFFWIAYTVLFVAFLGVLFGLALSAGVDRLTAFRIPRAVGALLIVLTFFGVLTGVGYVAAPQLSRQLSELRSQLPDAVDQAERWIEKQQQGLLSVVAGDEAARPGAARPAGDTTGQATGEATNQDDTASVRRGIAAQLSGVAGRLFAFLSSTVAVLGGLLLILFIAIYLAVEPGTYQRGLMHLIPKTSRPRAREVLENTGVMLRRWLVTQLIGMVIIGSVTALVLSLLDVKAALALGVIAGLLEFIPYAGPIIAAVPGIAMAFLDSPEKALWVTLAYIGIQQLEGQIVTPLLMREGLELPPVLTIVTQALMGLIFGFIGLLVAVPLLGAVIVPIKMLYVHDVVGDEVSLPADGE